MSNDYGAVDIYVPVDITCDILVEIAMVICRSMLCNWSNQTLKLNQEYGVGLRVKKERREISIFGTL